ncbi:tetratricopeptide repeat protein [bacterium]|nr:tetratricopeptide repeat protein [bacterium]
MKWLITWSCACTLIFSACGGSSSTISTDNSVNAEALFNQGLESYKQRDYDKARYSLLQASTSKKLSSGQMIQLHKHLAFIYAMQKQNSEAADEFLKAFTLDKDFTLDKAEMGNPFWTPAFEDAQKQFGLLSISGNDLFVTAKDHYEKRNYDEALKYFNTTLKKLDLSLDNKVQSYKYLAFIYAVQKKTDAAKEAFKKAFHLNKKFELDKGEYGNPVWTPIFDEIKKEMSK